MQSKSLSIQKYFSVIPILIMLLGLSLRLYQLGKDSLWLDEVENAIVVQNLIFLRQWLRLNCM